MQDRQKTRTAISRWWRKWRGAVVYTLIAVTLLAAVIAFYELIGSTSHAFLWGWMNVIADYFQGAQVRDNVQLSDINWGSIAALATLLTVLVNAVLLASVIFGFRSVQEGQSSRSAQVLIWAMKQMDAVKADERLVRASSPDYQTWNDEVRGAANRTRNAYQRLCYFARQGLIDKRHFRSLWGVNITIYWSILKDYVVSERQRFGDKPSVHDGAYLAADFEALGEEFRRHYQRTHKGLIEGYESSPHEAKVGAEKEN